MAVRAGGFRHHGAEYDGRDTLRVWNPLSLVPICHGSLIRLRVFRPVTAEAAGSSPVSRAILVNGLARLLKKSSQQKSRPRAAVFVSLEKTRGLLDLGNVRAGHDHRLAGLHDMR